MPTAVHLPRPGSLLRSPSWPRLLLLMLPMLDAPAGAAEATTDRVTARSMSANQQRVLNDINYSRRAKGKRSLDPNGLMNQRAQNWAQHLVNCQCLEHRPPPYGTPQGWCAAAENVGRSGNGGRLGQLHDAFMRSDGHRANILNSRWTAVGVGVARDRAGEYFVVHAFADFSC